MILHKKHENFFFEGGGGVKFRLKRRHFLTIFLLDFMNFRKVILDILRPEIVTLVTLGKFVFSGDVICERPLVEIFIKNMTH